MRNTVVALGELRTAASGECFITDPHNGSSVAWNLVLGDEKLPEGTPVLVVALPDVEPETIQRIIWAVQETKRAAALRDTDGGAP